MDTWTDRVEYILIQFAPMVAYPEDFECFRCYILWIGKINLVVEHPFFCMKTWIAFLSAFSISIYLVRNTTSLYIV